MLHPVYYVWGQMGGRNPEEEEDGFEGVSHEAVGLGRREGGVVPEARFLFKAPPGGGVPGNRKQGVEKTLENI